MKYPYIKMSQKNIAKRPWTYMYSEDFVTKSVIIFKNIHTAKAIKQFNKAQLDVTSLATQIAVDVFNELLENLGTGDKLLAQLNSPFGCMINTINGEEFVGTKVITSGFIKWESSTHNTSAYIMDEFRNFMMTYIQSKRENLSFKGGYSAYNTPIMCIARLAITQAETKMGNIYNADGLMVDYLDTSFRNYLMCRITTKLICRGMKQYIDTNIAIKHSM